MINKIFRDYMEEEYNKEKNYEKIIFREKEVVKMKRIQKRVLNLAACVLVIIFVGTLSSKIYAKIQWDIKFKEFQNRALVTENGEIKESSEPGYSEPIDMDYVSHDGISVKINSLMITDDEFSAIVDFKFDDNINVDSQRFSYGYAIYDENKNVYAIGKRINMASKEMYDYFTPFMYERIGAKYNKKDIYGSQLGDSWNVGLVSAEDRNIVTKIDIGTSKSFPKSKKICMRILDLGYTMMQLVEENGEKKIGATEDFKLSNTEWLFELNVPDKFYERETTELKLKDEIPGLNLEKITVTETGMVVRGVIDNLSKFLMDGMNMDTDEWNKKRYDLIHISDEDGNDYPVLDFATTGVENGFYISIPITKSMLNKKLILHAEINGVEYSSELVEKH